MADILVETDVHANFSESGVRAGPVWTSLLIGYVFYTDAAGNFQYVKTIDGGATWGSITEIATGAVTFDVWYDRWTPGDAGTLIHLFWTNQVIDDVMYRSLDTSIDTFVAAELSVHNGATFNANPGRGSTNLSGTKAKNGNLYVQWWGDNTAEDGFQRGISPYEAANWSARTNGADGVTVDYILCFPDPVSVDQADIVMLYWDRSVSEISIKKYDDSANTWTETVFATGMINANLIHNWNGAIRFSDNHLIMAAWESPNLTVGDLQVWDINVATPSGVKKTSVVAASSQSICTDIFIDQNNDDLYVVYLGAEDGSEEVGVGVHCYYKKSTDGGVTWGAQTQVSETIDDHRFVSVGMMVRSEFGGRFEPVWYNDDLDDLLVNFGNSIAFSPADVETFIENRTDVIRSSNKVVGY